MTTPTMQALIPPEPTLADLLNIKKKEVMIDLNCHAIGTVQSFDRDFQTATATINYKRTLTQLDQSTGAYVPTLVDYPVLLDCPCIVVGGGLGALTFPIANGDECLVLFNDRDLDNWFQGGTGSAPATPRMHSISDGIIIVGLRSQAKVLANYDPVRAVLRLGQAMVAVGGGDGLLVKIGNTTTLGTLMQSLLTDLQTMATGAATEFTAQATASTGPLLPLAPGFTSLATTFATLATALSGLATQFSGVLE